MPYGAFFGTNNMLYAFWEHFYERDLVERSWFVWTISLYKMPGTSDLISVFVKCMFFSWNMKFTGTYDRFNNYLLCITLIGREQLINKGWLIRGGNGWRILHYPAPPPPPFPTPTLHLPPACHHPQIPLFVQLIARRNTILPLLAPDASSMQRR